MLSFINITLCFSNNFVSALSYQSEVGIGFTFDPTLSISLSYSDLVISNLTPGTTSDSNGINISVATNSAYGYILTTSVGNSTIYNSTDLIHNNSNNVFSSIPTNTSLSSLEDSSDNNIWGYSYKLSSSNTWSNYSGLPLYNSPLKVLLNADSNDEINNAVDFKIATKASATQASGEYNNVINFSAVTKPTPTTLAEAYANYYSATNKTMHNGYYVMQDMADSHICENTEAIGSELQVIDIRDDKVYWIAKLADGKCWMTQNLDLDLSNSTPLTSTNTDLTDHSLTGVYASGYTYDANTDIITWAPASSATTRNFEGTDITGWSSSATQPYSANKTDNASTGHASLGNYYNWTTAIASNNSDSLTGSTYGNIANNPKNSICPKGWRLPTISSQPETTEGSTNEFARINYLYNSNSADDGARLTLSPTYLVMAGAIGNYGKSLYNFETQGRYWSSTVETRFSVYYLQFSDTEVLPSTKANVRDNSATIRCLAK